MRLTGSLGQQRNTSVLNRKLFGLQMSCVSTVRGNASELSGLHLPQGLLPKFCSTDLSPGETKRSQTEQASCLINSLPEKAIGLHQVPFYLIWRRQSNSPPQKKTFSCAVLQPHHWLKVLSARYKFLIHIEVALRLPTAKWCETPLCRVSMQASRNHEGMPAEHKKGTGYD